MNYKLNKKKALIIGIHDWFSPIKVGSHHIAEVLSEKDDWEVLYISLPLSPLHSLSRKKETRYKERYKTYKSNGTKVNESLTSYVPYSYLVPNDKPFFNTKLVFKYWHHSSNLMKKITEFGFNNVDLLYMDNPIYSFLLESINYKKSVFRIADNHKEFKGFTRIYGMSEELLINKVDLVLYTAKELGDTIAKNAGQKMYFPNGVRFNHFQIKKEKNYIPKELMGISKPICLYVGAIKEWFDYELVNYCAKRLPNFSFVIIGPMDKNNKTENLDNVYFLGPKSYSDIPYYMNAANIGIIPFDVKNHEELINSVNPLKLYEYMSSGLPVVSTSWNEIEKCQSPAFLTNDYGEFVGNLKTASLLGKEKKDDYISFARSNDWNNKVNRLLKHLQLI